MTVAVLLLALLLACGGSAGTSSAPPPPPPADAPPASTPPATTPPTGGGTPTGPGWVTLAREDFEAVDLGAPAWSDGPAPDDGPYSDDGAYYRSLGVTSPPAQRLTQPFGAAGWLTAESYTRTAGTPFTSLLSVVPDPANAANRVLRLASPAHSDATVIRSSAPLPDRYRVSLRVGFVSFGDGKPGLNGYPAEVSAAPWRTDAANTQNGFYWLAILDATPRPHNNTWIHHHRKVMFDSDNNYPEWTQVWDGSAFVTSGQHPIIMQALDGKGPRKALTGEPFIPYSAGAWQPSGTIRAVDAYLDGEWYDVAIERSGTEYTLEMSGRFRYGGQTTYRATIDARARCVWHFNRTTAEDASGCVDESSLPGVPGVPAWPAGETWPDWFMLGDPHENYYAGEMFVDDVKLEVWHE